MSGRQRRGIQTARRPTVFYTIKSSSREGDFLKLVGNVRSIACSKAYQLYIHMNYWLQSVEVSWGWWRQNSQTRFWERRSQNWERRFQFSNYSKNKILFFCPRTNFIRGKVSAPHPAKISIGKCARKGCKPFRVLHLEIFGTRYQLVPAAPYTRIFEEFSKI